jgi:hypothetical protein
VSHAEPITVESLGGERYRVRIGSRTQHEVTAVPAVLARVARPDETPETTIRRSFEFLLQREPPESILRRFALADIGRYFPEFWTAMTR